MCSGHAWIKYVDERIQRAHISHVSGSRCCFESLDSLKVTIVGRFQTERWVSNEVIVVKVGVSSEGEEEVSELDSDDRVQWLGNAPES